LFGDKTLQEVINDLEGNVKDQEKIKKLKQDINDVMNNNLMFHWFMSKLDMAIPFIDFENILPKPNDAQEKFMQQLEEECPTCEELYSGGVNKMN
jgi:hypothetical protein